MKSRLVVDVSRAVMRELSDRAAQTGLELSELVDVLLAESLELNRHSLFQVSTSNALVQGVFGGAVTVGELKLHGDFGLGTFAQLDGELILLEGGCYRATANGHISEVEDDVEVPFALVTEFASDLTAELDDVSMESFLVEIDRLRPSYNLFVGIRAEGRFDRVSLRAVCGAEPGEGLADVAARQSEFAAHDVEGTLVGFWSPDYTQAISIPGYHFHFVSVDRDVGGHVFGFEARRFMIDLQFESDMHLALPETAEFLSADLAGDHRQEIDRVEHAASDSD